ncbi:hypothetical protein LY78DRAFT_150237 [Colletotrichum sublineola]|nr:hypothetical protein LY78DRAFT_150237 [Colletotrichum sublineola]
MGLCRPLRAPITGVDGTATSATFGMGFFFSGTGHVSQPARLNGCNKFPARASRSKSVLVQHVGEPIGQRLHKFLSHCHGRRVWDGDRELGELTHGVRGALNSLQLPSSLFAPQLFRVQLALEERAMRRTRHETGNPLGRHGELASSRIILGQPPVPRCLVSLFSIAASHPSCSSSVAWLKR